MEDQLGAADGVVDPLVALDVALDQLDVIGEVQEVLAPAGGEVVEHPDATSVAAEPVDKMGADEAPTSGDKDDVAR